MPPGLFCDTATQAAVLQLVCCKIFLLTCLDQLVWTKRFNERHENDHALRLRDPHQGMTVDCDQLLQRGPYMPIPGSSLHLAEYRLIQMLPNA